MTKAHTLSAGQVAAFPNMLRSQEMIEPMMLGKVAAALPAKLARARPRACRCFFIHSLTPPPPLVGWLWSQQWGAPPPVTARTRVLIAMPIAVRMLAIVIPCSRKRVRIHSASVLSSCRSHLMVSRILLICDWRAALFMERASSLACLSSSMSESLPLSFPIRSRISCWISMSSVSVSFWRSLAKCFSTLDFRWLCQVVSELISCSRHGLPHSGKLSRDQGYPRSAHWQIPDSLQDGFDISCCLNDVLGHAGEVLQLNGFNVFREGFLCILECSAGNAIPRWQWWRKMLVSLTSLAGSSWPPSSLCGLTSGQPMMTRFMAVAAA